jgi:protein SCO1/2
MSAAYRWLGAVWLAAMLAACGSSRPPAPDFSLTDDAGNAWTLSAQRGHPVLLTFGFTHCADTCPATLAKLARLAHTKLGQRGKNLTIAMVTVDPRRDSPAVLHAFVSRFGRPIAGLTGSPQQIRSVENAYHVWAQPLPPKRKTGDYDVVHSAAIYLIDSGGRIAGLLEDDDSEASMAHAVGRLLE